MPKPDKGDDVTEYHIHLHQGQDDAAIAAITNLANLVQSAMPTMVDSVNQLRQQVQSLEETVATDFTNLETQISEMRTVAEGVGALVADLAQQLRDAAEAPDVTARVNELADELDQVKDNLVAAVEANVPPHIEPQA